MNPTKQDIINQLNRIRDKKNSCIGDIHDLYMALDTTIDSDLESKLNQAINDEESQLLKFEKIIKIYKGD